MWRCRRRRGGCGCRAREDGEGERGARGEGRGSERRAGAEVSGELGQHEPRAAGMVSREGVIVPWRNSVVTARMPSTRAKLCARPAIASPSVTAGGGGAEPEGAGAGGGGSAASARGRGGAPGG